MSDDGEMDVEEQQDDLDLDEVGESSDDESAASSQKAAAAASSKSSKPAAAGAKKEKATKKDAKATKAKSEKKAPAKRKDAGGAEPATKKAKAAAPDDPKDHVRQYMLQQNRPYTALVVYENLHQSIKKPALIKYLDELTEEGHLQSKDFKKVRIYLAKQDDSAAPDPAELDGLAAQETSLREQLADVKAKNTKLSESIRALQNEPSDADLATQLAAFQKQVDGLNTRLARIKGDSKLVSKAGMDKAQSQFNEAFKQWSKRKRAATGMIDDMAGEEGEPKKVAEHLGIETDEDAEVKLADWKDLVKEVKK